MPPSMLVLAGSPSDCPTRGRPGLQPHGLFGALGGSQEPRVGDPAALGGAGRTPRRTHSGLRGRAGRLAGAAGGTAACTPGFRPEPFSGQQAVPNMTSSLTPVRRDGAGEARTVTVVGTRSEERHGWASGTVDLSQCGPEQVPGQRWPSGPVGLTSLQTALTHAGQNILKCT